jgi:hypothetical protein
MKKKNGIHIGRKCVASPVVLPKNKKGVVYLNVDHRVADNGGEGYDGYEQQ